MYITPSTFADDYMFICHFVSPNEFSEGIMCVSTCASYFVHLSATKSSTIHIEWENWL